MRLTFVSNYLNHHQIPFCEAMLARGTDLHFVQTEKLDGERARMGWKDASARPYVLDWERDRESVREHILSDDCVLMGWAPAAEDLVEERLLAGKLTLRMSERIYKDGQWKAVSPRGLADKFRRYTRFAKKPYYLLCAGAYVGSDFSLVGAFPGKKLTWGYFPEVREIRPEELFERRRARAVPELVWSGRFVDFKHVETVLWLAGRLASENERFHLTIAGGGEGEEEFRGQIREKGLERFVTVTGFTGPEQVRSVMEQGDIFVFTSDAGEGWGAVVNEAMNSALAVVASNEAGAVPSLVEHGRNGLMYPCRDREKLLQDVRELLHDAALRERLSLAAYETMRDMWNAGQAADRLTAFLERALAGEDPMRDLPERGPVSRDACLKPFLRV